MGFEISGLAGLLALSLPLAALATVVLLAARGARRRPVPRLEARPGEASRPAAMEAPPPPTASETAAARIGGASPPSYPLDEQLHRARRLAASGKAIDAADALRACLWQAGIQSRRDMQASARLELGDLCLAAGDPITACEHWQIARDYFGELKDEAGMAAIETRMRSNGCPTDWVLNDF